MDYGKLPSYGERDYLGDKGVRLVDQLISDNLRWIFRDLRKIDLGIDGQIELVDEEKRGTGRLIAINPGEFLGRREVEARAADLSRDLAQAVRKGVRYPATDQDLVFWHFMGWLIKENKRLMHADQEHWEKLGLYESFEAFIGQSRSLMPQNPEIRNAWIEDLMERQKNFHVGANDACSEFSPKGSVTLIDLLKAMPQRLDPRAAVGLKIIYQFEVSGSENFIAHLQIENQQAFFHEGPAEMPDVRIITPATVWLSIACGELDSPKALMAGKYQVLGDKGLLIKLNSLFRR